MQDGFFYMYITTRIHFDGITTPNVFTKSYVGILAYKTLNMNKEILKDIFLCHVILAVKELFLCFLNFCQAYLQVKVPEDSSVQTG